MGRVATRSVAPIDRNKDCTQSGHRTSGPPRVARGLRSRAATTGAASLRQNANNNLFDHVAVTTAVHLDVYGPKNADRNACRKNGPFVTHRRALVSELKGPQPFSRCDQAGSK
jgi:hypothetical protein